jgi:alpha-mannosidase
MKTGYVPRNGAKGFSLSGKNVTLSTIRPAQKEGWICLRLINYSGDAETVQLDCPLAISQAFHANLAECLLNEIPHSGKRLQFLIGGWKIATILLELACNN